MRTIIIENYEPSTGVTGVSSIKFHDFVAFLLLPKLSVQILAVAGRDVTLLEGAANQVSPE